MLASPILRNRRVNASGNASNDIAAEEYTPHFSRISYALDWVEIFDRPTIRVITPEFTPSSCGGFELQACIRFGSIHTVLLHSHGLR
jgi:hypothetical protein